MKTAPKNDTHQNEGTRRNERAELHKNISGMPLIEKIKFLKQSFKCHEGNKKQEFITGKKSFFGKEKVTNKCQFQPKTDVDLKHIIAFCCNDNFVNCPIYQYQACTTGLLTHRHR